jgi:hypothetical protein
MAKETICKHCNKVFESKGKYNAHFRLEHQNQLRDQDKRFVQKVINQNN